MSLSMFVFLNSGFASILKLRKSNLIYRILTFIVSLKESRLGGVDGEVRLADQLLKGGPVDRVTDLVKFEIGLKKIGSFINQFDIYRRRNKSNTKITENFD
jgi:hypothetical protein